LKFYRITPKQYLENYNGLGGSYKEGARWNVKGIQVMYFSLSPAVAMLEMANYLPSPRLVPKSYRLGIYEIDDSLVDTLNEDLPPNWADYPYPSETQQIGSKWLLSGSNLVLLVPSAATPDGLESIAVINAAHPKCKNIKLIDTKKKLFNERVFSGLR
jgi:RES domain-containing protein